MEDSSHARLDVFKSKLVRDARFSPVYEFPLLEPVNFKPDQALPFEKACRIAGRSLQWVHFYTYDRHFECVWNNPERYLPLFQRFSGVITPDFSLYREMPLAMQIWNTYRNRAIGFWLQRAGVPVVPNVRWGDERTHRFAFEGLVPGGSVAVSAVGSLRDKADREYFKKGLDKMVEALAPQTIICYGQTPDDVFGRHRDQGLDIVAIPHHALTVRQGVR